MDNIFNLSAALRGAKIQTRNGLPARIIAHNINNLYTLAVIVTEPDETEVLLRYNKYGKPVCNDRTGGTFYSYFHDYKYDLIMATEHITKYLNLLKNKQNGNVVTSRLFDTEKEAKEFDYTNFDVVKTIKIEYDIWN